MDKGPETSIIIRTKNEARWLGEVLRRLLRQSYQDFEVVIIDSGSTDKTLEIARGFQDRVRLQILQISPDKYTYPFALNMAIAHSRASKYLCIMSAHSLPISASWLEDGITDFSLDKKVFCVAGYTGALPDATFLDRVLYGLGEIKFHLTEGKGRHFIKEFKFGALGFTNAIILKSFWESRKFNEKYAAGGEDDEWVRYFLKKGYIGVKDIKFKVLHSHYLGLISWIKQYTYWQWVQKPHPFKHLAFRTPSADLPRTTDS